MSELLSDTTAIDRSVPAQNARPALYAMAAGNFAVGTGALVVAGIVPEVANDLAVSDAAAGQLLTIYALFYAVSAPALSILTSRFDKRLLLLVAAAGLVVTNVAAALAPSYAALMAARAVSALFAAMLTPVAASVATMISKPENVGSAIGLVFGGVAISTVLGVPAGALIGGLFGWQAAFALVAGLAVLGLIAMALAVPRNLPRAPARFSDLTRILTDRPALSAVGVTAAQMTAQFIPYSFAAVFFAAALDASPTTIFVLLLLFGMASVFGNHIGGVLADRLGAVRVIRWGLFILPLALTALYLAPLGLPAAMMAVAVWGAVGFSYNAPQQARLVALRPYDRTTILALNASAIYVGTTCGGIVGGLLLASIGVWSLPAAGVLVAGLAIFVFYRSL